MKSLIAAVALSILPFSSFAGEQLELEDFGFYALGRAVESTEPLPLIANCVKGAEVVAESETPKVTLRLRKKQNQYSESSVDIIAEMVMIYKSSRIENISAAYSKYFSAEKFKNVCGDRYISEIDYGARVAFVWTVEKTEAEKVPSLELIETDASRTTEFADQALAVFSTLKGITGAGFECLGTCTLPKNGMGQAFEDYRAAVLPSPLKGIIRVAIEEYPEAIVKEIVK